MDTNIDPSYSRNTDPDTVLNRSFCMYATKALAAAKGTNIISGD